MIEQLVKFGVSKAHHGLRPAARAFVQSRRFDDVPDVCRVVRRPSFNIEMLLLLMVTSLA
jgi:hypothetical protein